MFGGVAEDAWLDAAITRPHEDVDVLVPRHDLERRLAQLAALGFTEWETYLTDSMGRPQVLNGARDGVHLEIAIFDGAPGNYWFEFARPEGGHYLFYPPADMFEHPPVRLDGVAVRTVTPLTQYVIRAALIAAGSFGEPRPKDLAVQPRLRALLGDVDDDALVPRLDRVR